MLDCCVITVLLHMCEHSCIIYIAGVPQLYSTCHTYGYFERVA